MEESHRHTACEHPVEVWCTPGGDHIVHFEDMALTTSLEVRLFACIQRPKVKLAMPDIAGALYRHRAHQSGPQVSVVDILRLVSVRQPL